MIFSISIEEKDVKPFTGSELSDWEDRRESNSQDTKKPKDESELSSDTVRMYLKEIGRVNLLSAADEIVLARSIETSIYIKKILLLLNYKTVLLQLVVLTNKDQIFEGLLVLNH